jgi:hypothetical protein
MRPQNAYPPILGKIARFLEETDVMSTNSEQVTALIKVLPILNRVGSTPTFDPAHRKAGRGTEVQTNESESRKNSYNFLVFMIERGPDPDQSGRGGVEKAFGLTMDGINKAIDVGREEDYLND